MISTAEAPIMQKPLKSNRKLGIWLLVMAGLVFGLVIVGGLTRLTNSGLSIVEWKPVTDWLPPLSDQAWEVEFSKYKAFPEYQKINRGMSLAEFQSIYAWEYAHRLYGRLIGFAFALPLAWFFVTGQIAKAHMPRLIGLFFLGGLQGGVGWFMVKSGLIDRPDVSHYRLALHFGMAVLIFGLLLWMALDLLRPQTHFVKTQTIPRIATSTLVAAIYLQLLTGAMVAGLDGGFIYNTWPDMNGNFLPEDWLHLSPAWLNFFENPSTVQFIHRTGAYCVIGLGIWSAIQSWKLHVARLAVKLLLTTLVLQVMLGLATLLLIVPVPIASAHQAGALLLFAAALNLRHRLR